MPHVPRRAVACGLAALLAAVLSACGNDTSLPRTDAMTQELAVETVPHHGPDSYAPRTIRLSPPAVKPRRAPSTGDTRPNIVFLLTDDMRTADLRFMPETRRLLLHEGLFFRNAISPNPLCAPSRASLLTGQYSHDNGVLNNGGFYGGLQALRGPNNTLPVWLQRAGYDTAFFGKYLNGYGNTDTSLRPAGWNWWDATGKDTYDYLRFQFANNGDSEFYDHGYITTAITQRSRAVMDAMIGQRNRTGKPFFLWDSYVSPHISAADGTPLTEALDRGPIPQAKYRGLYAGVVNPSEHKPSFGIPMKHLGVKWMRQSQLSPMELAEQQVIFRARIEALKSVDNSIATLIHTLARRHQLSNTDIVFGSDNGYLLGELDRTGKTAALREALSVPLVVRGPGFPRDQVSSRWATIPDITATIMDLARARTLGGRRMDGVSLVGASGSDPTAATATLLENGRGAEHRNNRAYHYHGVMLGTRYIYTYWPWPRPAQYLVDLKRDPYELVNVAKQPRYRRILRLAQRYTAKLEHCHAAGCYPRRTRWPAPR
jgi:N-acetylglucosamine-6-sulfatase